MQMATISRWTLAYFGCALTALVAALSLIALGVGHPGDAVAAPMTLIVVHLLAIGWLTLLMIGALFQFLPVLVGGDLARSRLAPVALVLILAGLGLLLAGFAGLDGHAGLAAELMPAGGLVLLAGFGVAALVLFTTLLRAKSLPLPAGFVAVGLLSVLVTALVGETLASAVAGLIGGEFAVALVTHGVPLHAGFGLGGWLTMAAMGVSYRLLSMFLVAPERGGMWPRLVFWGGVAALGVLCTSLGALMAFNAPWPLALGVAAAAGAVALGAYLRDVVTLYRTRRRKELELHTGAAIAAFAMLPAGALVLVRGNLLDSEAGVGAGVYLLILGWLSGLGLAMLYKIIPFLTWLECFAPLMGRRPTPRVQDLVREQRAGVWFAAYFAAVSVGAVAIVAELPLVLRAATLIQLMAVLLLIAQFYRARRLADLPADWRDLPRPRLFLPAKRQRTFP